MAVKPKLALIPSGVKASKVYSVLPSNGVGDFDFSRSGEATRINKDGLIETVASNVPRLNYPLIDGVVSGCPSLLLENSSTNLVTYSEDYSNASWSKINATITSNAILSPKGDLTADKLVEDNSTLIHSVDFSATSSNADYSRSIYAKKGGRSIVQITQNGVFSNCYANFDLENGVVTASALCTADIKLISNGWYKCTITANFLLRASPISIFSIRTQSNPLANRTDTYTGDGTSGIYIWGAQLEQQSYPTSYIPTSGSATTRSAETCNGAGDANTFNDSEGVLMVEMSALNNTVSAYNSIGLGNGLVTNRIGLGFQPNDTIYAYKRGGSSAYWLPFKTVDITSLNKVALSYNTNDNHFWVNGFKIASNTTIGDASNLTELEFEASYGLEEFYGNTKQIQYFDTALNDTDLEELTSWQSFNEMATAQQYSIL